MKTILSATAAFVVFATAALADEVPPPQPKVQQNDDPAKQTEDCSKQVWPHFSQACLRPEGKGIAVRLVTIEHR